MKLEDLKKFSCEQLYLHWHKGNFPFEMSTSCGNCLLQHGAYTQPCNLPEHEELQHRMNTIWKTEGDVSRILTKHLEELYALRLLYKDLYSTSVPHEVEQQEPVEAT